MLSACDVLGTVASTEDTVHKTKTLDFVELYYSGGNR